jgi:hypothetical protein
VERNGGHGGYRRLVEGCANAIRMGRAPPRPRVLKECAGVVTRRRRCKENIKSMSTRASVKPTRKQVARGCHVIVSRNFALSPIAMRRTKRTESNPHRDQQVSRAIPILYPSTPSWALLGIFLKLYGIRSAAERSGSAVVSEVTSSALVLWMTTPLSQQLVGSTLN